MYTPQAISRSVFGKFSGPRCTAGGRAVLQPGLEEGDNFPRLQHALLPWFLFKHQMGPIQGSRVGLALCYSQLPLS